MYSEAGRLFLSSSVRQEIHYQHAEVSGHTHSCSLAGPDLACSIFPPHEDPMPDPREHPPGTRDPGASSPPTEGPWHPCIFSLSAQPHSAPRGLIQPTACRVERRWDGPAGAALRSQGTTSQGSAPPGWLPESHVLLPAPRVPLPPLRASGACEMWPVLNCPRIRARL